MCFLIKKFVLDELCLLIFQRKILEKTMKKKPKAPLL